MDFKAYGSIRQLLGNEFQSLIGILVDFQVDCSGGETQVAAGVFQSLIGILVDFQPFKDILDQIGGGFNP